MKKRLCAVLDKVSGYMCEPFTSVSIAQAQQRFGYACSVDYDSQIFHHPEDYRLIHLADLDDMTGEITPCNIVIDDGNSYLAARDGNREKYYAQKILLSEKEDMPT